MRFPTIRSRLLVPDVRSIRWGQWLRSSSLMAGGAALLVVMGFAIAIAPWAIALLLAALLILGATALLLAFTTRGAALWVRACVAVVMAQLILNYGFATAVIPVGSAGVPLSELVLTFSILACAHHLALAREKVAIPPLLGAVCLWALLTLLLHLPLGLAEHGFAAARDALPTAEVLFVLPGFVAAHQLMRLPDGGERFLKRCLAVFVLVAGVYGLGYAVQDSLIKYSPRMPSIQQSVPLLGSYQTWPVIGLFGMLAFSLWRWQATTPLTLGPSLAGVLIFVSGTYTFFATQSRAAYVIVAFFLVCMLLLGGQARRVWVLLGAIVCAMLVFLLLETLGLELKGRVSNLSTTQIMDHILTLSGDSSGSEFQGAAGGIAQRRAWIEYSLNLWQQDIASIIFGVGYGEVLTNHTVIGYQGQTILVREPHNSYVSILTRSGAVGLMVNGALHLTLLAACISMYRRHYRERRGLAALALGVLFIHIFCLLTALGQPLLESPHFAVPLHFLLGAMYAVARQHRNALRS